MCSKAVKAVILDVSVPLVTVAAACVVEQLSFDRAGKKSVERRPFLSDL